jgi:hypothetical protein
MRYRYITCTFTASINVSVTTQCLSVHAASPPSHKTPVMRQRQILHMTPSTSIISTHAQTVTPSAESAPRFNVHVKIYATEGRADRSYGRLILFAEVYCIRYLGIEDGDVEPRNVVAKAKRRSCFFKIIDFGFLHKRQPFSGWKRCGELKDMRHKFQLDMVNFRFKIRVVASLDYHLPTGM